MQPSSPQERAGSMHGNFCFSASDAINCCLSDSGNFSHLPCKLVMAAGVMVVEACLCCLATDADCLANCLNIVMRYMGF